MAAITWYARNETVSGFTEMRDGGSPGANATASPVTGWIVGTGATNHAEYATGVERASSTFTGTTVPDGSIDATLADCWRSDAALSGDFASGDWNVHFAAIAVSNGGSQDGRMRCRLLKADADGSNATEITSAHQQGGLVTNLATSAQQTSTATFNPGAFSITNQYVFIQLAWERTGAGGMTTADVDMRIGDTASRVISSDFTVSAAYTLTADAGAFTLTGQAANLVVGRAVTAATGSFALTGNAAPLVATRTITADVGTFALTGNDAQFGLGFGMPAETGSFALTGNSAGLLAQRGVAAETVAFALTGSSAGLAAQRRLGAAVGALALSGVDAGLRAGRAVASATGTFALSGAAAGLAVGRRLASAVGAFAFTGNAADLIYGAGGYSIAAELGALTLTGVAASLRAARQIIASPGAFVLTGLAAALSYDDGTDDPTIVQGHDASRAAHVGAWRVSPVVKTGQED